MINTKFIRHALASASLALGIAAAPVAISAQFGVTSQAAAAKEAESGGKHSEAGNNRGGNKGGNNKGGQRAGDDHPGSHSQNGKRK